MSEPSWNAPLGQGDEFARLVRQARRRRMHHGLLLTGPRGVGKTMTAEYLARTLLCEGDGLEGPCGVCASCRHIALHPDLVRVEIPEDKDEIPVDLVRELRATLQRLPVQGRARVVIVDPADRLNVQGQNAMLKTLEEPGRSTFLLLPTRCPEALLDTVRSRVVSLRLLPLDDAAVLEALHDPTGPTAGIDAAELAWAAGLAGGCLGLARELVTASIRPLHELLDGFVLAQRGSPIQVARAALEGATGRLGSLERARWTMWTLRTILRKELGAALASEGTGPYSAPTSVRWTAKIETLFDAESDLALRIPPEQVLAHALAAIASRD